MKLMCLFLLTTIYTFTAFAQIASIEKQFNNDEDAISTNEGKARSFFGMASYYADKFNGRKTATGETYDQAKFTAACNVLALGTWIRVTNLRNNKSVIVQINDRLHPKNKRIIDLSKVAAEKLGYISRGLTQVKLEVLGKRKPS